MGVTRGDGTRPRSHFAGANSLSAAIDASVTTITLNDTSTGGDFQTGSFPSSGVAYIGSERISYTGISGNQLIGVTRGDGTRPRSHPASETVVTEEVALTSSSGSSVNTTAQENRKRNKKKKTI